MLEVLIISQVVLLVLVVGLAVVVLALARQVGVFHERIAPLGALMMDRTVDVGEAAPVLEALDLRGRKLSVGGAREDGKSQVLLFVSPVCPMCKKLLLVAKSFARRERREVELVLVGDGERDEQERLVRENKVEALPYILSPVVGMTFQVGKLPYAVLIDERGVVRAKGLVNSREHLESLLTAKQTGYASIQDYLKANLDGGGVAGQEDKVPAVQSL